MKTHEDRIVGMYTPGCTRYLYPMLDVLMWTLVWIGVAAIHLDYLKVDVAVWGLSEKSTPKYFTENWRQFFSKELELLLQKNEAFPYKHLMRSMDLGIMSCLSAHEDFMCCDHSVCESASLCEVKLLDILPWNTFSTFSRCMFSLMLGHTTSSYYKTRLIQLDVFSLCKLSCMYSQLGIPWVTLKLIIFFFFFKSYLFIKVLCSYSFFLNHMSSNP